MAAQVRFLGYERRLAVGETVTVDASHDDRDLRVLAEPDGALFRRGLAVQWPQVNVSSARLSNAAPVGRTHRRLAAPTAGWPHPPRGRAALNGTPLGASFLIWQSLAYHWPMIADEGRNGCFDKALDRAIRAMVAAGRCPHVT